MFVGRVQIRRDGTVNRIACRSDERENAGAFAKTAKTNIRPCATTVHNVLAKVTDAQDPPLRTRYILLFCIWLRYELAVRSRSQKGFAE